jgi:hypothetical protein
MSMMLSEGVQRIDQRLIHPKPRRGDHRSPDTRSCIALAGWTGVQTLSPARLFWSWGLQDHRYEMIEVKARGWSKTRSENPP